MSFEHILDRMAVSAEPFALCELRGECDLGLGRRSSATLHYVLAGQGGIVLPGRQLISVRKGSLVLVPALQSHSLRSFGDGGHRFPSCSPAKLNLAAHFLEAGETKGGSQLVALCTHVTIGLSGVRDLIDLVRAPIVEGPGSGRGRQPALKGIVDEISNPGLGSRAMIRALLLQCMIDILRRRIAAKDQALAWMAALEDHNVWKALSLMLDAPGDPHSVESLADAVGMSRSTFAKRFSEAYDGGPMELLRNLRVQKAATLLEETDLPIKRIAESVGFRSRSAFTRMFERFTGTAPQSFRRSQRAKL